MARDKRIAQLMVWHRRIGLFMVVVLLVVIATGVLMNHQEQLHLADIKLKNTALLRWYGLESNPSNRGYQMEDGNWLAASDGKLYVNEQAITACPDALQSSVDFQGLYLALCKNALMLITREGELLEEITPALGLPQGANRLGIATDVLVIETLNQPLRFDIDTLAAVPLESGEPVWPAAQPLPEKLANALDPASISAEKLVQDIHSGRLFGPIGIFLVDLSALLLLVLTFTGLWSWLRHEKLQRRKD